MTCAPLRYAYEGICTARIPLHIQAFMHGMGLYMERENHIHAGFVRPYVGCGLIYVWLIWVWLSSHMTSGIVPVEVNTAFNCT